MATTYDVTDNLVGKTLSQVRDEQNLGFRPDILASQLGIAPDAAFTKGQVLNSRGVDTTSAEGKILSQLFGTGMSEEMRAVQPAIQSLQASQPEIQQKYATERTRLEGEKDPLSKRYDSIIADLTRRQGVEETSAIKRTAQEFGKRGVPLSSSLYQNEEAGALSPIRELYGGLARDTGLSREDSLRNINNLISGLVPQETGDLRSITNAIAQLQAGAGNSAIDNAFKQLQMSEQQRQFNTSTGLQREQMSVSQKAAEIENAIRQQQMALQQQQYSNIDLPTALAQIANINSTIANRGKSSQNLPDLNAIFGDG